MNHKTTLLTCAIALALLAGCKQDAAGTASDDSGSGFRTTLEGVAQDAKDKGAFPSGEAPLQPGQTIQGYIEADVGKGTQRFRSLSTKVAENIGEQMDEKLGTGDGKEAIDKANQALDKAGLSTKVDAASVRSTIASMAGKVFSDSSVLRIGIVNQLQASLEGTAGDARLKLNLTFDDKTGALGKASAAYYPDGSRIFDNYETDDVQVTLDRFERNEDGTYAAVGSFEAKNLEVSKMSKKLSGNVPRIAGRFDFAALPFKEM